MDETPFSVCLFVCFLLPLIHSVRFVLNHVCVQPELSKKKAFFWYAFVVFQLCIVCMDDERKSASPSLQQQIGITLSFSPTFDETET